MKLPPLEPRPDEIVMTRAPDAETSLFRLSSGDSHYMTVEEAVLYLQLLGVKQPDKLIDWLWNFNALYLDVETGEYSVIPYHATCEVFENAAAITELLPLVG